MMIVLSGDRGLAGGFTRTSARPPSASGKRRRKKAPKCSSRASQEGSRLPPAPPRDGRARLAASLREPRREQGSSGRAVCDGEVPQGRGRRRLHRLQRVQERDHAGDPARAAVAVARAGGAQRRAAPADRIQFEPNERAVLERMVPMYIEISIFRSMLETQAGFFGAQMTAMDAATRNAKDMIGRLTLVYNRARQASITKELMEIIGGAEALKEYGLDSASGRFCPALSPSPASTQGRCAHLLGHAELTHVLAVRRARVARRDDLAAAHGLRARAFAFVRALEAHARRRSPRRRRSRR